MSHYQTLARRYRPQNFTEVIGQETVVTILKNALKLKRIANAYIFSGSKGTGKTTLARIFAKALNCLNPTNQEPCNQCASCLEIQSHTSLDVIEIDGASNRGIDDIRQINDTCGYTPANGLYKIYIIDEVHMLTKEAFNALLKTLEEPPAHVKFFFATTEPHKVLPTILSRCQRFDLLRLTPVQIIEKLTKIAKDLNVKVTDSAYKLMAKISAGSLRDAESLMDQLLCLNMDAIDAPLIQNTLGIFSIERFFPFDEAYQKEDYAFAFTFAEMLFKEGVDIHYFYETFLEHIRNILNALFGHPFSSAIYTEDQIAHYQKIKSAYKKEQCFYIFNILMKQLQQQYKLFSQVHLELFLLHLIESKNRVSLQEVMQEIQGLEMGTLSHTPKQEAAPSLPAPSPVTPTTPPVIKEEKAAEPPSKQLDTLMQFASVELHGSIKK